MITVDAALRDLEAIEKESEAMAPMVKALKVMIKFLSTMRSNQLLTDDDKKRIRVEKEGRDSKRKEVKKV